MKEDSLTGKTFTATTVGNKEITISEAGATGNVTVMVDCYVLKNEATVQEVQIDAENFAGYYYVEGETYFRKQINGKDMPAYLTIPNVKIQSNFTFTMASSGDPSTFTFTMDAFPGYTYFDKTKKVLCVIQIVDETKAPKPNTKSVMIHEEDETFDLDENGVEDNDQLDSPDSYGKGPVKKTIKDLNFTTGSYDSENDIVNVANGGGITAIALSSTSEDKNGWTPSVKDGTGLSITTSGSYKVTIKYTKDSKEITQVIPFKVKVATE